MIGLKIYNYEIKSLLGQGGMGAVYLAEHPVLDRRVAVKVLKRELAEDLTLVARFVNEAKAAATIRQPNVIEVFDVGVLPDGLPYLMMELLEGETLGRRLDRQRRLPVRDAVAIACQAAAGLEAAHALGIVHRDVKPDNLFLVPDAGDEKTGTRVKVLDFGIAKLKRELGGGSFRTHTGSLMGTPAYMSPEQCRGISAEIDHRSDVYSMGIILHEMLAGAPPFISEGFGDILMMHIAQPPRPLREIDPDLHPAIEAVVLRALEKDRNRRFPSMAALKSALAAAVEGQMPRASDAGAGAPGATPDRTPSEARAAELSTARLSVVRNARVVERTSTSTSTSTTLTSANGQMLAAGDASPRPARSRTPLLVAGTAIAGVAAVVALALLQGRGGSHATPALSAVPGPAATTAAPRETGTGTATATPTAAATGTATPTPTLTPTGIGGGTPAAGPAPSDAPAAPAEEPAPPDSPAAGRKSAHITSAIKRKRTTASVRAPPPPSPSASPSPSPSPSPAPPPAAAPPPSAHAAEAPPAKPGKPTIRIDKW